MAPALTQTEPPNLADTTCHTPETNTNTPLPYENLKILKKIKSPQNTKEFCESEQILTSNGDCVSPSLAPPACGWAEGRPSPNSSPAQLNMDKQSPLPISNCGNSHTSSEQSASTNSNMGLQTHVANFGAASSLIGKAAEAVTVSHEDSNPVLGNQSDLLALVGRDFDNVNEIIDTLQRLASNPELLDAAAQELEPQNSNNSQNAQTRNQTPEDHATLSLNRLSERQQKLQRRRQFLLRRLHRVTARGLGMTISSQINYMTKHIGGLLEEERTKNREKCEKENVEEPIGLELLHKESMKSMSTSDLISLVRRVEASNNLQRQNDRAKKALCIPEEISNIPTPLAAELDTVASEMKGAVLAHVSHDSDATESSSGGESCDESEFFSENNTDYKPIKERAFYKFCRRRGWIASKWMWLQAQIADLDYRILQQRKYFVHLRKNKGAIQLAEEPQHVKSPIPMKRSPAHLEMQDPALTCIGSPGPRTVLNGYHPSSKMEDMNSLNGFANGHEFLNVGCARTFGIHKVKRRRYIKPNLILKRSIDGISNNNSTNKYVKVSPVFCKCVPPVTCVLCVRFRTSNKNTSIYENYWATLSKLGAKSAFSFPEKLSRKDPGFHSILSRISEFQQGEVYSSLLKSSTWQQKCLVCKPVTTYQRENLSSSSEILEQPSVKRKKKNKEHKRNGRRKHLREDSRDRITLKLKKSMFIDTFEQENTLKDAKTNLEISEIPAGGTTKNVNDEELVDFDDESGSVQVSVSGSANSSPCPSPAFPEKGAKGGQSDLKNSKKPLTSSRQKQNSTSSSYDINNIVIPYSMAAASRVELIQYKEIPTPKWRIEEILPLPLSQRNDADAEEIEDISDEAIVVRHRKSEIDEHKKYLNYYNSLSKASRSSRTRRADSSGTNTPDNPLSPRPSESLLECSPVGSPDTPLTPQYELIAENPSTVLTLSLSSLKSSLLKTDHHLSLESEELNNSSNCNLSSLKCQPKTLSAPPSSCVLESSEAPLPALRTRRSHSTNITNLAHPPLEKPRLSSLSEEQSEKERISPFPSRNFPLKENEYLDLVCVNDNDSNNNKNSNTNNNDSGDEEGENSFGIYGQSEERESTCTSNHRNTAIELAEKKDCKIDHFCIDEESGRGSPLSELTDSAPEQEEEGSWEEGASATPPDWTISAVNDQCGGFVLTVQKN